MIQDRDLSGTEFALKHNGKAFPTWLDLFMRAKVLQWNKKGRVWTILKTVEYNLAYKSSSCNDSVHLSPISKDKKIVLSLAFDNETRPFTTYDITLKRRPSDQIYQVEDLNDHVNFFIHVKPSGEVLPRVKTVTRREPDTNFIARSSSDFFCAAVYVRETSI
ncbi:hypothetical protein RF11_01888 [Thelohanellus kitauei]|uniref:Uncharacterized protein n=1 Tax=Thelohanellus kitauei TaxID=669202 RepID=A0A0C2MNR3_THEKT|nr:hypothetical protein RF11_01888 [Thelohanellus kitauei]